MQDNKKKLYIVTAVVVVAIAIAIGVFLTVNGINDSNAKKAAKEAAAKPSNSIRANNIKTLRGASRGPGDAMTMHR